MSNCSIEDTSPLFRYSPYGDGNIGGGWASFYSVSGFNTAPGEGSQGDSSHLTSFSGASVNLTFVGSSIIVFGTANCSYDITIDGATPATIAAPPSPSILYSNPSLSNATHTIALTAHPTDSSEVLGIDKAIVAVPFDANATVPTVVDNSNTSWITYEPQSAWTVPPVDAQIPNRANPKPYHTTTTSQSFASLNWTGGTAIAVSGIVNDGHWTYMVTLDGQTEMYNSSSWWIVPDALLYFQPFTGANDSTPHSLTISNAAAEKLSLNYITLHGKVSQLTATPASTPTSAPSPTPTPSQASTSHTNVDVIVGPIIGVLFVLGLVAAFFFLRRRRSHTMAIGTGSEDVTPYNALNQMHPSSHLDVPDMRHQGSLTPLVTDAHRERPKKGIPVMYPTTSGSGSTQSTFPTTSALSGATSREALRGQRRPNRIPTRARPRPRLRSPRAPSQRSTWTGSWI